MKKKIIVFIVFMLLTASFIFPVNGFKKSVNAKEKINDQLDLKIDISDFTITNDFKISLNNEKLVNLDGEYHIYEGFHWKLHVTVYWEPPNPERPICVWAEPSTLPQGASFPECTCDYGQVTATLEWTPAVGQAGTYTLIFYAGESCYEPIGSFPITVVVHKYNPDPSDEFTICAETQWHLTVTAYWVPPQPEKIICLWVDTGSLPYGATFTECHCDYGQVFSDLYWTPTSSQVGEYIITFLVGDYCGYYDYPFSILVNVISCDSPYTFSQTNFNLGETSIQDSSWGHVDVVYTGTEYLQYFNLEVNNRWEIRNAPLMPTQGIGVENHVGLIFDLEVNDGTDVNLINVITNIGTTMLSSPPSGPPSTVPVYDIEVTVGGRGEEPVTVSDPEPVERNPAYTIVDSAWNFGMVNQDCGVNECVPTAFSNSLRWLDQENDDLNIPENKKSIHALKPVTHWTPSGTPIDGSDWRGKRDFTSDYVTTRKFEMNQIDDVIDEIKDGQDVELMAPHHGAVVTGICKFADGKYVIQVTHDTNQGHNGGTQDQMIIYDSNTGLVTSGAYGIDAGAGLDWFVVECPKEEENNPPEAPERPTGETSGRTGFSYDYETETTDPDNDQISYGWDWNGDNTVDEWTSLYASGATVTSSHAWINDGTYNVKVRGKDEHGLEGEWSDPLTVTMPKEKIVYIPFLKIFKILYDFYTKIQLIQKVF